MRLRRLTLTEWITLGSIAAIFVAFVVIPDSNTATRRSLERLAAEWQPTRPTELPDHSILASEIDLSGQWARGGLLARSHLSFTARPDSSYDLQFDTGGCGGSCELARVATCLGGVVALDAAVAEYSGSVYSTLYAIRIQDREYLLPAESVLEFETKLVEGDANWQWYLFSRKNQPIGEM